MAATIKLKMKVKNIYGSYLCGGECDSIMVGFYSSMRFKQAWADNDMEKPGFEFGQRLPLMINNIRENINALFGGISQYLCTIRR